MILIKTTRAGYKVIMHDIPADRVETELLLKKIQLEEQHGWLFLDEERIGNSIINNYLDEYQRPVSLVICSGVAKNVSIN